MSTPDQEATREEVRKQFGQLMREYIAENSINALEKRLADFQKIFNAAIHHLQGETNANEERVTLFRERLNNLNKLTFEIETAWKNFEASRDTVKAKINAEHAHYENLEKRLESFQDLLIRIQNEEGRIALICNTVDAQYEKLTKDYELASLKLDRNEALLSELQRTVKTQSEEIDLLSKNKAVTTGQIEEPEVVKRKRGRPRKNQPKPGTEELIRTVLAQNGPSTATEISKATGIPKTVLYGVLKGHFVSDGSVIFYNSKWKIPKKGPKK